MRQFAPAYWGPLTALAVTMVTTVLAPGLAQPAQYELTGTAAGARAILSANPGRFAGAVDSFIWKDKEFLDSRDHGRLMQSAVVLDKLADCYNPTEAGSAADATGNHTSSRLLALAARGGVLQTAVDAAFWLPPGTPSPHGACGTRTDLRAAVNTAPRAGYTISKAVRFGSPAGNNVLDWNVTFGIPAPHKSADFEALTAYMPMDFSSVYEYRPGAGAETLSRRGGRHAELSGPVVLATSDGAYAMGAVCKAASGTQKLTYGYWNFGRVMKWNCSFEQAPLLVGNYSYHIYVVFGSLDDVRTTLGRL